jgi:transcriptional regulator with XRE-family HTH domain
VLDEVRRLRKLKGLTQVELAELAGVSAYTITEIETGHREPRPSTLRKLAGALDADVADFFPRAPAPSPESALVTALPNAEERIDYRQMYLELGKRQFEFVDEVLAEVADVLTTEDYDEFIKLPVDEQHLRIETAERLNALAMEMLESIKVEKTDELTRRRERLSATSAAIREFKKTA